MFEDLKPKILWKHFLEMTKIPRPSGKEEKIRDYFIGWAKKHRFDFKQDKIGNMVIYVPATKGYENRPTTVIQGHMDMVAEKNSDSKVDPTKDPLDVYIDDGWVKARGTTLGADNGIGLAMGLAIAEDAESKHGSLELLLTVAEETTMLGSTKLDTSLIKGRQLINLDAEIFGELLIGCAGADYSVLRLPVEFEAAPKNYEPLKVVISGLKGGHSGLDIHLNRANSIKILASTLHSLVNKVDCRVSKVSGGGKRNAIPREARADLLIKKGDIPNAKNVIKEREEFFKREYAEIEDDLSISLEKGDASGRTFPNASIKKLVGFIASLPDGLMAWSRNVPGVVETSNNIGILETDEEFTRIETYQRSSVPESLEAMREEFAIISDSFGVRIEHIAGYPPWQPDPKSKILELGKQCYKSLHGEEPKVTVVHGGLETALLGDRIKGMDMISFAPNLEFLHSPEEKVHVETTEKCYHLLRKILESV